MSGDPAPGGRQGERLALVAWSAIAEPMDEPAYALVHVLGAARALEWAVSAGSEPVEAARQVADHALPRTAQAMVAASERWRARLRDSPPERHLERAGLLGARVVVRGDAGWPRALDSLGPAAPFCLWARGPADLATAWERSIALVGSRHCTGYGDQVAATIAAGCADAGLAVISGGAYGIDACAHRGALAVGGTTVAVMAGGVDRLYPAGNAELLGRVLAEGAVVSESPPGFAPHRGRFLTRNRLIAAAGGTVVVEAAHRSGALSTAHHCVEMGRPLGVVPGPVTSAASAGCHRLAREAGAQLVTSAAEAVELCSPLDASRTNGPGGILLRQPSARPPAEDFGDPRERAAFDALTRGGSTAAEAAKAAGLTVAEATTALGGLELEGRVERRGDRWRRVAPGGRPGKG